MTRRIPLLQTPRWHQHQSQRGAYSPHHCCHCGRPVATDAVKLRTVRTNDGAWWVKPNDEPLLPDEQNFGEAILPVGPTCYAHPNGSAQ